MDFEIKIIEFLQANASVTWIRILSGITLLGGFFGLVVGAVMLWKRGKGLATALVITYLFASLVNAILKVIIARQRPFEVSSSIINLGNETGYSFPSGHSVGAGVIAVFLFYGLASSKQSKGTKIAGCIAICLYPLLIAFTRMALGVHYLTDTLAGIFLGFLLALIGLKIYNIAAIKINLMRKEGISDDE